ncbi:MAG: hypothetical protein KKG09_04470 [Verrucomicrobia bacterium]|nr:hypothetical protein [Verrucomicrobiota bacterium]MCG2680489.1 hypothetical protein [Kiritimatiellia bacterium]MBU4247767.1 hypothetical protein [Verrucomicrobiota bacterium]MBU4289574.1 hypothetical protein [Verrucomicrobiota bacterium]MBU4428744.1 hypothetical protein [Verrucomicrobiota bacterium]
MMRREIYVVILAFVMAGQGFGIDYYQHENFGEKQPGDVVSFTVTPPGTVISGSVINPGGFLWFGGPATWTGTIPTNFAGVHNGLFRGTYQPPGGGGPGPSREYTWEADTKAVVCKLTLTMDEYLGISMVDPTNTPVDSGTATATLSPAISATYSWLLGSGITHFDPDPGSGNTAIIKEEGIASGSYRNEKVMVSARGLTAETNFTVVRIDIQMQDLDEANEEVVGAFVPLNSDDDNANGVPDLSEAPVTNENDLVELTIALYPGDLPADETVSITGSENLYEDQEKQTQASAGYPVSRFPLTLWVEGQSVSSDLRDKEIMVTHIASGAKDKVKYTVLKADLDIDSDNNNGFDDPDRSDAEDTIEDIEGDPDKPGKLICVNDGDEDHDGVPDFADGFDKWGNEGANAGGAFTPLILEIAEPIDLEKAKVTFVYLASDPDGVTRTGAGTEADPYIYTPARGKLRIWTVDGWADRQKAEVNQDGDFVGSGSEYKASDLGSGRVITLYVEGIEKSENIADQQIKVEVDPGEGIMCPDAVRCTVIQMDLVPDWNHDRVIDSADESQATAPNPFRFWINDDADSGDISEDDSDVPGHSGGLFGSANYDNSHVDGRSDLLDFFPVWLDLNQTLNISPPSDTVQYKLKQANGAVNVVYTDLTKDHAGDFLTTEGNTYGPSFNQNSYEADTFEVTSSGVTLSTNFLNKIKNDATKGILLIEGAGTTTSPLVLEVWKDGVKICEKVMPLSIDGVEKMYRWINVRGVAGGDVSRATDTIAPSNYPDSNCNGKQFIFVHGYSVHEEAARAWNAEMFKRLYQSGSRAMFTAVTWFGNDGQIADWIPFVGGSTPDYYVNVEHAFETASNLVSIINASIPGSKRIAGHSLGNMVVSSAIIDHGLSVNAYFMLNAAVAMEAYNATFDHRNVMRHPDWQSYDSRLWASEWYQLFTSGDGRNTLRWGDRFGTVSAAFNYYSETEDVLNNANGDVPAIGTERAWVNQEMRKGTTLMWIAPGNAEAGWGFNDDYDGLTVTEANALPDSTIRTNSFFAHFDDEDLYGTNGSTIAQQPAMHCQLLADAIPALSNPAGRNSIGSAAGQGNRDYMTYGGATGFRRGLYANGDWPEEDNRWHHSDLKRIAYPYNSRAFDQIVNDGGLK